MNIIITDISPEVVSYHCDGEVYYDMKTLFVSYEVTSDELNFNGTIRFTVTDEDELFSISSLKKSIVTNIQETFNKVDGWFDDYA